MGLLNEKVIELLNYRIEQEEMSSRLYKSMSIWCNYNGYFGASKLLDTYSKEELVHAEMAYNYLLDLDYMPEIPKLDEPQCDFESFQIIINKIYDHEVKITNQCQELAKVCNNVYDFMTLQLAQQYLKEQVEEVNKAKYWLDRLEAFGDSSVALRMLDEEMGK